MAYFGLVGGAAKLVGISASYIQSGSVYTYTPLDFLKSDLTVTATYDNGQTLTVTSYTLSGTLTEGTSTITVSYNGKTDTFDVTVSESGQGTLVYEWDFTESMYDKKQNKQADGSNITQNSQGVSNETLYGYLRLFNLGDLTNKTIEVDVSSVTKDNTYPFSWLFATTSDSYLSYTNTNGWKATRDNASQSKAYSSEQTSFSNCTIKFVFTTDHVRITIDDVLFYEGGTFNSAYNTYNTFFVNNNIQPYGMFTVTGARVYQNL